jgi:hypothetical protein
MRSEGQIAAASRPERQAATVRFSLEMSARLIEKTSKCRSQIPAISIHQELSKMKDDPN